MPTRSPLLCLIALASLPALAQAQSDGGTVRPAPRVDATPPTANPAEDAAAPQRPDPRPSDLRDRAYAAETRGLRAWAEQFRGRALAQGVRGDVFDAAFAELTYDANVIARDRNQSEFVKPIWAYLDSAVSDARVENGRAALAEHGRILDAIEARYGVEKEIVAAIWGLESAYGEFRGDTPVIPALATLAHDGRRGKFFEAQLIGALRILQAGDTTPSEMTGSWAGAMGHTQFIPTSYLSYAVDFTGDGKRDIWSDNPADALASTAAYLSGFGWVQGQPWGVEVQLPDGFDYTTAGRATRKLPSEWAALGVTDTTGGAVDDYGPASILLPAGATGAAFLIFDNFGVIERYNTADAYVIGVGHLADRIAGGDPIAAQWPRDARTLTFDERVELQRLLTASGYDTQGADGRIGPNTMAAIRRYQASSGAVPDGYASLRLLENLRGQSG